MCVRERVREREREWMDASFSRSTVTEFKLSVSRDRAAKRCNKVRSIYCQLPRCPLPLHATSLKLLSFMTLIKSVFNHHMSSNPTFWQNHKIIRENESMLLFLLLHIMSSRCQWRPCRVTERTGQMQWSLGTYCIWFWVQFESWNDFHDVPLAEMTW